VPDREDPRLDADDIERLVRLGPKELTWPEVCARAGVSHEVADPLWRALGFPDIPHDERAYTRDDVRALRIAAEGIESLRGDHRRAALDAIVREARMVSSHMTRIAEIEIESLAEVSALGLRERVLAEARQRGLEHSDLGLVLLYAFRRRLDEGLRRRTTLETGDHPTLAVGFVDLVDFARTSASMETDDLGRLLDRFEALASDIITETGGRIVKLIGDEAMLVPHRRRGCSGRDRARGCLRRRRPALSPRRPVAGASPGARRRLLRSRGQPGQSAGGRRPSRHRPRR
jgi:adenylate cyclase